MAYRRTDFYQEIDSRKQKKQIKARQKRSKENARVISSKLNAVPAAGSSLGLGRYLRNLAITGGVLLGGYYILHDHAHSRHVTVSAPTSALSSVMHAQREAAQKIVQAPMSAAEKAARPYVARILGNQDLANTITDIAATNGTSIADMLQVIAAETSGDPAQFKPNIIGARTAMQITPDQFVRLLGTYGQTYADRMRAFALQTGDRAALINAQADELGFVAQFIQSVPNTLRFTENNAAYQHYMQKHMQDAAYPPLRQRIDNLYANGYVSMGMQNLSDARDTAILDQKLRAQRIAPPAAPERVLNYLGLPRAYDFFTTLHASPNVPVIGNLMDQKTAINNQVAYRMKTVTAFVGGHQELMKVPETHQVKIWVPASGHGKKKKKGHFEKIDQPIPVTVADMYHVQIEPGERAHLGFAESYKRFSASRLLQLSSN